MDQYSLGVNILVHGITQPPGNAIETNLDLHMISVLNNNLNLSLTTTDISAIHRLPKPHPSSSTTASTATSTTIKPPPILIQFANKKTRNAVLLKRKELKGRGFSLTEHLTAKKSTLLHLANEAVKNKRIQSAWSHEGKIIVRTFNNRSIVLLSASDLDQF